MDEALAPRPLSCGACNMCCRLLEVKDIDKPAGMMCWHTSVHGGCAVHKMKLTDELIAEHKAASGEDLAACAGWECIWLNSQRLADPARRGSRPMRPDLCHVMFWTPFPDDPSHLFANVDPEYPDAWMKADVAAYMEEISARGARFTVIIGDVQFEYEPKGIYERAEQVYIPSETPA